MISYTYEDSETDNCCLELRLVIYFELLRKDSFVKRQFGLAIFNALTWIKSVMPRIDLALLNQKCICQGNVIIKNCIS